MSSKLNYENKKSELKPEDEIKNATYSVKNKEAYIHLEKIDSRLPQFVGAQSELQNLINENIKSAADINNLNNIFNSYSTKKTFATGLLDLALIATNFSQMKQLILLKRSSEWHVVDIVIMFSICASLILQIICGIVLVFTTKQEDFYNEEKRNRSVKNNNSITLIVLAIAIVNIFINVFINI